MTTFRKKVSRSKTLWLLVLSAVCVRPAHAADPAGTPAPAQSPTIALEYREMAEPMASWSITPQVRPEPFAKEPASDAKQIQRGTLTFGADTANNLGFFWDVPAGKLHLDLNRNGDLTDDATGVFAVGKSASSHQTTFRSVPLTFKTPAGERRCLADLDLAVSRGWNYGYLRLRSFWQGRLVLDNEDWQVGVVENPFDASARPGKNQYLLLRPWAERDQAFHADSGSLNLLPFAGKIFFRNHAFAVALTNEPAAGGSSFKLLLTGQQPVLGELNLTGQFIQRLILEGAPGTVVIAPPVGSLRIPVGEYTQTKVWLNHGDREASRQVTGKRITIRDTQPAELVIGGPLTNTVATSQRGHNLQLRYKLIGADGEDYQLSQVDRSKPPTFAVFKGDQQVGSGKFEFG